MKMLNSPLGLILLNFLNVKTQFLLQSLQLLNTHADPWIHWPAVDTDRTFQCFQIFYLKEGEKLINVPLYGFSATKSTDAFLNLKTNTMFHRLVSQYSFYTCTFTPSHRHIHLYVIIYVYMCINSCKKHLLKAKYCDKYDIYDCKQHRCGPELKKLLSLVCKTVHTLTENILINQQLYQDSHEYKRWTNLVRQGGKIVLGIYKSNLNDE